MDEELEHESDGVELLVVVEDGDELHECAYTLNYSALERWESMDLTDPETGLLLVRTLVLLKLREHNSSLHQLLVRNCYPAEFINGGITTSMCEDVPRLGLVNSIIEKVYGTLSSAVIELGFRTVH
jgi:hypothetical protein